MRCTKCLSEMALEDAFCVRCGTARMPPRDCQNCGTLLRAEAKFCPKCGHADMVVEPNSANGVSASPEREAFFALFPNMRSPTATGRSDYWRSFFIASIAESVAGVFCGILIFEVTRSPSLSNLVFWVLGLYIYFRVFGHKYVGRLIDAGLRDNTSLKNKTIVAASVALLGGFLAWWLAAIGWLGLVAIFIFVGSAPKSRKSTGTSRASKTLPETNSEGEHALEEGDIVENTPLQECKSALLARGYRVRSLGENDWEVVDPTGETYHVKSIEGLKFLANEKAHSQTRTTAA